jgi:hypothetical protein
MQILLAFAYTYNRPVHVFQYSSRPVFNSDEHVPQTQNEWCAKADEASRVKGLGRGSDWSTVQLNGRGKAREPIRLSIHVFGRPRYAAVLRASVGQGDDSVDPRVVRLFEVSSPAQTSVKLVSNTETHTHADNYLVSYFDSTAAVADVARFRLVFVASLVGQLVGNRGRCAVVHAGSCPAARQASRRW